MQTATITGADSSQNVLDIPTFVGDALVTSIGHHAFWYHEEITEVHMSDFIKTIESYGFGECRGLKTIELNDGLKTIGAGAFNTCASLGITIIPESVDTVGQYAFNYCYKFMALTSAPVVKPGWTSGSGLYSSNTVCGYAGVMEESEDGNMIIILRDNGIKQFGSILKWNRLSYGDITDYVCPSYMSDGVTPIEEIGPDSLFSCLSVEGKFTLPEHTKTICYMSMPTAYVTEVVLGNEVEVIEADAFNQCNIEKIHIPSSVRSIGDGAFFWCDDLTEVTFDEGITDIGGMAFQHCVSLESVTLPASLTNVGDYLFYECENMTGISLKGTVTSGFSSKWNYDEDDNEITFVENYVEPLA